jgi:hypothetical protein
MANSFDFLEVKFNELTTNVKKWTQDLYNKSNINLTSASPYSQVLEACTYLYSSAISYLKNITSQFDINNPTNNNAKMINFTAVVAGYNPYRSISSTGTISLSIKSGTDIPKQILIYHGTRLSNNTNSLNYYIDLGTDYKSYTLSPDSIISLPIVQGNLETQIFTGNGEKLQSISVQTPAYKYTEQFRITAKVNGQVYTKKDSLNDMLPNENAYVVRTGIDSSLDIFFGNGFFGAIPQLGSSIEITYVVSDGSSGDITHDLVNDFTFIDDIFDETQNTINISEIFNISIQDTISMGADKESLEFTKRMIPNVSRNFVFATTEQYIFAIKRLNYYSQVDAYSQTNTTDSIVNILLVPDISRYITNTNNSYFKLDYSAFIVDNFEKTKLETMIRQQGTVFMGTTIKYVDAILRKYICNVSVRLFEGSDRDAVFSEIYQIIGKYIGNIERRGVISKSDLIVLIEQISDIDSVMIDFVSEQNETYHREYVLYKESVTKQNPNIDPNKIIMPNYDPRSVLGLDELGDIIYDKNELVLMRGGFMDRNGVYFNDGVDATKPSSVNIRVISSTSKKLIFS